MSQSLIKLTVHKVGFISPPAWFDISPTEFLRIVPENTIVMQTVMRPPDFNYSVEHFINSVPELGICFDSLAAAGADVVGGPVWIPFFFGSWMGKSSTDSKKHSG